MLDAVTKGYLALHPEAAARALAKLDRRDAAEAFNAMPRQLAGQVLARIENSATLVTFPVTTMLAGVVIDRALSLGEAVGRDKPVFVVADLDTVWVDIAVYLRDLEQVAVELSAANTTFQSLSISGAQTLGLSLFDYLG